MNPGALREVNVTSLFSSFSCLQYICMCSEKVVGVTGSEKVAFIEYTLDTTLKGSQGN